MDKEDKPIVKIYMISFCTKEGPEKVQTIHFDSAEVLLDFKHRLEVNFGDNLFINYVGEVNVCHELTDSLLKEVEDYFA